MERQRKAPPAVYTPTRGDPSTLQNLPGSYQPPQPSVRIATNHTTQPAVPKSSYTSSPYGVPFKPEHNSNAGDVPVRAASQRRGDGDGREQRSMDYGSPHEALPPAPDVPRAAPPISYRERYTNGAPPAPPQGSSRSFSARARALQMEANSPPMRRPSDEATSPVEQQAARPRRRSVSDSAAVSYPKTQPGVPASYSPSSTSAAIPRQRMGSTSSKQDGATTSPLSRSNTRMESGIQEGTGELSRNWASDRSPLQKLEVKLSDISKEEKRARVEEAEQLLRESMAARGERIPSNGIAQPRRVSGPAPNRSAEPDHRQQRSSSLQKTPTRRDTERSTGTRDQLSSQRQPQPDSPARRNNGDTLFKDSGRSVKFRDQQREVNHIDSQTRSDERQTGQTSQSNDRTARNGPGTSSGNGTPELMDRSSSRKFQQQQQPRVQQSTTNNTPSKEVPQGQQQLYINRFGSSRGDKSAADDSGIPDPVPVQAVQNTRGDVPRYAVPPQTAGGHQARQQVGFENAKNEAARVVPERKHHVPNLLHHGQRGPSLPLETPRVAPRRFDEWRKAKIARLTAADFSANTNSVTPNKAWWEQSGRDRQNQTRGSKAQDVGYDEELGTQISNIYETCAGIILSHTLSWL